MIGGGLWYGTGPGTNRFATTRGRIQGGLTTHGINYPHPFFDIAHTYLPVTIKQLFRWCRYYFLTNPLVNATVFKLSEYPITDIIVDHPSAEVRRRWEEYFQEHLRYRPFQIECGLDYHAFGNCMISLGFPFSKYLKCQQCGFQERADKIRNMWTFTNLSYRLSCPKCQTIGEAVPTDFYYKNAGGIKTIRWNCEHVEITYNDVTGESIYFYTIPPTVRNDIVVGKKDIVESVPQVFIQAMREKKGVVFSKENFFHMKRPTLAQQDRGWGIPISLPVLKDLFYLQIMKKAQEAILLEHVVPLRVLFPQPGSGSSDPYCVSPDTLVESANGLCAASEVKEGDYLRSHTGAWREVKATKLRSVREDEKVYKVTVDSLPAFPFVVSEDHPIYSLLRTTEGRGRDRQVWSDPNFIPIKELHVGDYIAYPIKRSRIDGVIDLRDYIDRAVTDKYIYRRLNQKAAEIYEWLEQENDPHFGWGERKEFLNERGWSDQDFATAHAMRTEQSIDRMNRFLPVNNDLATLAGYYLAEGSLTDGGLPSFGLNSSEDWIADEIEQAAIRLGFRGSSRYKSKLCDGMNIVVQDVLLGELLDGLCGHGFADKRIPQLLSEALDSVVIRMLRCLFAGDGCDFITATNRVALKMANPSIVLEARRLLLSFGLIGGITKEIPTEKSISKAPSYNLAYNGEQANAIRILLAGGKLLEPVWSKSGVIRDGYVFHRIAYIDEVKEETVIGFEMGVDKSFCVAGVATHNTTVNLIEWRDHVAAEIARWRYDSNYIPILPIPIGHQTIGGDGRALLLTQEIQAWSEHIMSGLGVPREFLLGGMSYAGTNVSMRMLENQFLGFILRHKQLANWIMRQVANYMNWPEASIRFKPFKMADDIQRKAYMFQLNQAQKVSDSTLLADCDLDQEKEDEIMIKETSKRFESSKKQQLAMAEIQGESQVVMAKSQAKAQQVMMEATQLPAAPGEPGDVGAGGIQESMTSPLNMQQSQGLLPAQGQQPLAGVDIHQLAQRIAEQIAQLPPEQQEMAIHNVQAQSPDLAKLVQQYLSQMGMAEQQQQAEQTAMQNAASKVDMRPLPEQRPPRRAATTV